MLLNFLPLAFKVESVGSLCERSRKSSGEDISIQASEGREYILSSSGVEASPVEL